MSTSSKRASFHVIGISIRTTNENNQAMSDIPPLWGRFMGEGIANKIPNKISDEIICIYTEYESDHTKPYSVILGCKVKDLGEVPDGMKAITVEGGEFASFVAQGDLSKGAVGEAWHRIWQAGLERKYTADYEVYGAKAQNPENAEVDIYVAI